MVVDEILSDYFIRVHFSKDLSQFFEWGLVASCNIKGHLGKHFMNTNCPYFIKQQIVHLGTCTYVAQPHG